MYLIETGHLTNTPGSVRAVLEAKVRLEAAGYEVIPFQAPDISKVLPLFSGMLSADWNESLYRNLENDLYDPALNTVVGGVALYKLPWILQKFIIHPLLGLFTRVPPIKYVQFFCFQNIGLNFTVQEIIHQVF